MTGFPITRDAPNGTVTIDHASCGFGFVVTFTANHVIRSRLGIRDRFETFTARHTAFAFFNAIGCGDNVARLEARSSTRGNTANASTTFVRPAALVADQGASRTSTQHSLSPPETSNIVGGDRRMHRTLLSV